MTAHPTTPRSIYAGKLSEFPEVAFADHDAFARRGQWRDCFSARIEKSFNGRIVLEIGCSDGAFLSRIAAKSSATAFVGLDWKFKSLYDAAARVTAQRLQNIALIRGRGQDIGKLFASRELDEIWVFHPDPCDRDVELKNRLINEPFLIDAHQTLRDQTSSLCLKTDHPGYYQWLLSLLGLPQPQSLLSPTAVGPRVRAKDLMKPNDLPSKSEGICDRFDVRLASTDYWNDPAALTHTRGRIFSAERTMCEDRFARKRFPIYYVEIAKK